MKHQVGTAEAVVLAKVSVVSSERTYDNINAAVREIHPEAKVVSTLTDNFHNIVRMKVEYPVYEATSSEATDDFFYQRFE